MSTQEKTLEELLLPGTPASVIASYKSLAERAKTARFGLLEDDVCVIDTETTGLSFKNCSLIEISAARLRGTKIVERFDSFVKPNEAIPPEITELTGIREADVVNAPSPEEAVKALADFVGGLPVLAHNAEFDKTFIERVAGGKDVSDIWVDTLTLSRIALPRLKSHKLADMAQAFGCDAVTHRAKDDVDALCGVWRVMLVALSDLPAGLLEELANMQAEVEWSYRPIFSQLALGSKASSFDLKALRKELITKTEGIEHEDVLEITRALQSPTAAEIDEEFSSEGALGRMYECYERRTDQLSMAHEVRDAFESSTFRAIEAGTGVGKSVAYLLPSALFAKMNKVGVGVATKTNALTDQLVTHELPALSKALEGGVSYISLKGYDHYPCLSRLTRAKTAALPLDQVPHDGRDENEIAQDMLNAIATVYAFVSQSPEGDLDALGIRWRYVPRQMLSTQASECLKTKCPFYPNECLVHGARRRAIESDIVVTNHSLLLRNVDADGAILPPIRHWVIDEAHGFEAEARRQWAIELSGEDARSHFEKLGGIKTGLLHALITQVAAQEDGSFVGGLLTKLAVSAQRAQMATAELFEQVHELSALAFENNSYDTTLLWISKDVRKSTEWAFLLEAMDQAVRALNETDHFAQDAIKTLSESDAQTASSLSDATHFIKEYVAGIQLIRRGDDDSYVYSAQLARSKRRISVEKLFAEKIDVGQDLGNRWLPEMKSVIFTSATIAIGDNFEHFEHAVGLDLLEEQLHSSRRLESSFDFDRNMSVVVTKGLPDPRSAAYLKAFEDLLFDVHCAMEGSVLSLFTNRREMEQVYAGLKPRLSAEGLDIVCQERSVSARRLRDRFLAEKDLSLMALKSFWEGFDAAGDALRCVVIPRLPFASPTDPLVQERQLRDSHAWHRHQLPEAVLEVKQAAGRLIRTANDAGVLVMADPRLVSKVYGRAFINSLPSKNISVLEAENVGRFIKTWRASRRR